MKFPICVPNRKQTASFGIVSLLLAIAPLWLMLAAVNTSAHAQASPSDWTEFHRDNMQRWNPYETVLGVNNVGNLQVKWELPLGSASSSPAVVNGIVYVGSDGNNLYALNANTGATVWSYNFAGGVYSSPAVSNGVVYVGWGDTSGALYALNASTGAKLWSFTTGFGVMSSPAVANGAVYFASDSVYALDASTGDKLWSFATGTGSSPAVANGVLYIGGGDGNVYALNASTGAKLWSYNTGYYLTSSPAVANGVLYIGGGDGNVYALNASTGAKLWSYTTSNLVNSSPAVANGVVYIGSLDGDVYALNASTGAKLWSYTTGNDVQASPAVANGVVYVGSEDSSVYALNAATGTRLWKYVTEGPFDSSPAVVDGVLYVLNGVYLSGTGHIHAFALNTATADLFLRILPTPETVHQGDLITYAFPVWNLGPSNADYEVLNTEVPEGTTLDYIRISGTPGLGTCTAPPYQGTGKILCHENSAMAPNTTWTVRVVVKVTAPAGTVITENVATMADTFDPNLANNTASVSLTVQ